MYECQILAAISFLLQSSDMRSLTLVNLDGSHNTPTTRKAQTDAMTVIIVRRNKCAFEREMPLSGRTHIHPTHDHPRTRPPTQIVNNHFESLEINFEWVNQIISSPAVCMSSVSRARVDIAITHLILQKWKLSQLITVSRHRNIQFTGHSTHTKQKRKCSADRGSKVSSRYI